MPLRARNRKARKCGGEGTTDRHRWLVARLGDKDSVSAHFICYLKLYNGKVVFLGCAKNTDFCSKGQVSNCMPTHVKSGAAYHSLGSENENLGSSPDWLAAIVATAQADRGNYSNSYLQNLANDRPPRSVEC